MGKRKFAKKIFAACVAAALCAGLAMPASAVFNNLLRDVTGLTGRSEIFLLVSLDDGSVIFSQNEHTRTAPASLTKFITAAVALEQLDDITEPVTVHAEDLAPVRGTAHSDLRDGEQVSAEHLIAAMLLHNASDAAQALAAHIAGSAEDFVPLMNDFAARAGAENTNFANVHGLDEDGHYTTAHDLALMVRHALRRDFPGSAVLERISGSLRHTVPESNLRGPRHLVNFNHITNRYRPHYFMPQAFAGKTGHTAAAGRCVLVTAQQAGFRYLAVVLQGQDAALTPGGPVRNTAKTDARVLINWAFANIRMQQVAETDRAVAEIPVELARGTDHVQLMPAQAVFAFVPQGVHAGNVLIEPIADTMPQSLTAPVQAGQQVGQARVLFAGVEFARVDLVAAEYVALSGTQYAVQVARRVAGSLLFQVIVGLIVLAAIGLVILVLLQRRKKSRKKQLHVLPKVGTR
ncbi:MAG: serine hydrolase [Oscillospiraceae bacterium]|nr:serine hydrolase [Oscillospiraceae bacterium]